MEPQPPPYSPAPSNIPGSPTLVCGTNVENAWISTFVQIAVTFHRLLFSIQEPIPSYALKRRLLMLYTKGLLAMDVHNPHFEETGITASRAKISIFASIASHTRRRVIHLSIDTFVWLLRQWRRVTPITDAMVVV
ncbi:hypothetical protein Moror_14046 [Moniliophthora roreri MCA 2997]|uniref:Uncharacterized protein n=1 Tax=Moniliophthora roreri (strain MCA 2997) TaxID=1381753 RepID=V2YT87_MONRO|nr:hypothetical protein Moror_14046 [Moniliophthora roreri MCA 2997]